MNNLFSFGIILICIAPFPLMFWVLRKYQDNNPPIETDIEARLRVIEEHLAL